MNASRTNASCRVALAALLHDLGKFVERARVPQAQELNQQGITLQAIHEQLYCPSWEGRPTHIHAAYTAMALDLLEEWLPELTGGDMTPFAPWGEKGADDSLINAAARHHRPETLLQWIIATADRLASGFEREEFEHYNRLPTQGEGTKNHYTIRQETLWERIRLHEKHGDSTSAWRYPLRPLTPETIFPVRVESCEPKDTATA